MFKHKHSHIEWYILEEIDIETIDKLNMSKENQMSPFKNGKWGMTDDDIRLEKKRNKKKAQERYRVRVVS